METAHRVLNISELLEIILLNLEYSDLLRVQRKRMWKRPAKINADDGGQPLFRMRHITSARPLLPNGTDALDAAEALINNIFDQSCSRKASKEYADDLDEVIRWPLNLPEALPEWPDDLSKCYCIICGGLHQRTLDFERLHPILNFLEETKGVCITGFGTDFRICIGYEDEDDNYPLELFRFDTICRKIRSTYDIVRTSNTGMDFVTQPPCKRLDISDLMPWFVWCEDDEGIRVHQLLFAMARFIHDALFTYHKRAARLSWGLAIYHFEPTNRQMNKIEDYENICRTHEDLHYVMEQMWPKCNVQGLRPVWEDSPDIGLRSLQDDWQMAQMKEANEDGSSEPDEDSPREPDEDEPTQPEEDGPREREEDVPREPDEPNPEDTAPIVHYVQSVFDVPELLEMVLLNLGYFELLRARGVCQAWRNCIRDVHTLQGLTWKRASEKGIDEDPLFEKKEIVSPRPILPDGRDVFTVFDRLTNDVLQRLAGPDNFDDFLREAEEAYFTAYKNVSREIDLPFSLPRMPTDISGRYCEVCNAFHERVFRYDHLHPVLRFLEQEECICISGSRCRLLISLAHIALRAPEAAIQSLEKLCKNLQAAFELARKSGIGKDLSTQPPSTLVMMSRRSGESSVTWNFRGFKVEQFLLYLADMAHYDFLINHFSCYEEAWEWAVTGNAPEFGRDEAVRNTELFAECHTRLHRIMKEMWWISLDSVRLAQG
ncbi:hypothetical protein K491DRAFT_684300 [Lophiostoma macrostomum CBS 122681]|uniref:F-box domain-containing protein n=1 Tax=Lophiostoma macrostomum CBS 122681 TaxID=1314788 RepID=A0A6A6SN10_9PLEO|nr:hypothetical protein K491DRAFT_684300 [Lophiostoma macrostomum CBS 122681]